MNLRIDSFSASFNYHNDSFQSIVGRLEAEGYRPLIRKLAQELCSVVGGELDDLNSPESTEEIDLEIISDINRRKLLGLEKLGYKWGLDGVRGLARVPELKGELFLADDSENVLLLTMLDVGSPKSAQNARPGMVRVGIVGAEPDSVLLDLFKADIASVLQERGDQVEWTADSIENPQFQEFLSAEENAMHALAAGISDREMKSAKALESTGVRDIATTIRKSGVILAKELLRSKPDTAADTAKYVDQLIQADLLHQEYVVICSKSGTHVNRVQHRETIDQMAKLGVLCSCGKKISDEAIEGLLSTDTLLPKMLDKNYWMTVSIVRSLMALGVPSSKILLNPSIVNDDVEILADLDGTLLMFNLKDAEYGIPHAISFTTRIGMHRPHMAFLVSTRGIASEVKDHFKRVKLDTQMVYIANMLQLDATLKKVVEGVRMLRVKTWFDTFQSMMNFGLTPLLVQRLESGKSEVKPESKPESRQQSAPQPKLQPEAKAGFKPLSGLEALRAKAAQQQENSSAALQQVDNQEPSAQTEHQSDASELAPAHFQESPTPSISAVEAEVAPIVTAPEPITETLETSYTHQAFDAPAEANHAVESQAFVQSGNQAPPPNPTAAFFAQPMFDDDDQASDSDVAVSELEELISEARESKITAEIEHVIPAPAMEFFAGESNGAHDHDAKDQAPPVQMNPYKRVMEMLNPPPVVTSVIIDEAPAVEHPPLSAMDILDNVLEAVATSDEPAAASPTAGINPAVPVNMFTEQYMGSHYATPAANQAAATDEEELPVATF